MINQSDFFNLYDVYVNELIGDMWLAILVSMIIVAYLGIKSKMPYQIIILLEIILLAVWFAETMILIIWVFIVLIVGVMFYYVVNKALQGR